MSNCLDQGQFCLGPICLRMSSADDTSKERVNGFKADNNIIKLFVNCQNKIH